MAKKAPESDQPSFFSEEEKKLIIELYLAPFSDAEREQFLVVCERAQLDPFTKQIYAVPQRISVGYGDGREFKTVLCIVTSIDGLRVIAERTGLYKGQTQPMWCNQDGQWKDLWLDDGQYPYAAKVGIHKEGFAEPLFAVARFASYVQQKKVRGAGGKDEWIPTTFWEKAPDVMTLKCAEAAALRRAFPQQLAGLMIEEEIRHDLAEDEPTKVEGKPDAGPQKELAGPQKELPGTPVESKPLRPVEPPPPKKEKAKEPAKQEQPAAQPAAEKTPEQPTASQPAEAPKPEAKEEPDAPWGDETDSGSDPILTDGAAEPACFDSVFTAIAAPEFKGLKIRDISLADLKRAKTYWIDKNTPKILQDTKPGGRLEQANWILQALRYHGEEVQLLG